MTTVTVLGTNAAYPGPDDACSGLLLQGKGCDLLLDCGTGVLSNLQRYVGLAGVSGIIITHMHADHFIDLVPYRYALRYGTQNRGPGKPRLFLPPRGTEVIEKAVAPFSESATFFSDVFAVSEYSPRRGFTIGPFKIEARLMQHYIPTYGLRINCGRTIVYSSDTGPFPGIVELAKGADLFFCNTGGSESVGAGPAGHLTAGEAAEVAAKAGVKELVLLHMWSGSDRHQMLEDARSVFKGRVQVASCLQKFDL